MIHVFRKQFCRAGGIFTHLPFKDLKGCQCIGFSTVSIFHLFAAEETVCGRKISGLHTAEDIVGIHDPSPGSAESQTGTGKLPGQHGNIKLQDIISTQVASLKKDKKIFGDLGKSRLIFHIFIIDPMDSTCLLRNVHLGIEQSCAGDFAAVRKNLQDGNFHDPVGKKIHTCGFKVKKYDGTVFDQSLIFSHPVTNYIFFQDLRKISEAESFLL